MDGCIFPYETRGVPPFFGWRWHVWKLVPGLRCFPFAISVPPLLGGVLISQHHGFVIAADR